MSKLSGCFGKIRMINGFFHLRPVNDKVDLAAAIIYAAQQMKCEGTPAAIPLDISHLIAGYLQTLNEQPVI
jgi:hypothetical protein